MSFSARGSPDSVQSRRLEMPQFFSTSRVKARSFSMFCWMWSWASSSRGFVFEWVEIGESGTQGVSRPKSTRMWPFCS